uniref:Uncharacterized protein n=1 Tax=Strigamia maritima TaxID=126957 RepID=T1IMM8_STRMM
MKRNPYYSNPMTSSGFGSNLYPILDASVTILSFAAFASLFTMAISRFIMNRPSTNTGGTGGTGLLGSIVSLGQKKNLNATYDNNDQVMNILNKADRACIEWRKCVKKNFYATRNKISSQECPRRPRSCSLTEAPQLPKPKPKPKNLAKQRHLAHLSSPWLAEDDGHWDARASPGGVGIMGIFIMTSSIGLWVCLCVVVIAIVALPSSAQMMEARKFATKMEPMVSNVADAMPSHSMPLPKPAESIKAPTFSFQNLFKTIFSMFTGKMDGESATKQILNLILSVIDTLKQTFTNRAMQARSHGSNNIGSDAAVTGLTFLKAYVRSMAAHDNKCVQKFLCEANKEAVERTNDIGHWIGTATSSAIGYLLERSKVATGDVIADASWKGRRGEDCAILYSMCSDKFSTNMQYLFAAFLYGLLLIQASTQDVSNENSVQHQMFSSKPFSGSTKENTLDSDDLDSGAKSPFTWSTLWSTLMSFFRGKSDGSGTKQLVSFMLSVLDMFKQYFMQRSAQSRGAIGIGRVGSDAASAILTMVKGYIKSSSARDEGCMQRYLCEVNREVVKDAREIGYIIGKAGSSVISYLLERSRLAPYDANYNASRRGLDGDNCETLSYDCNETY